MGQSQCLSQEGTNAIGYVGGGLLALSLVPQIVKLVMTRSAADISLGWTLLYILGTGLSLLYFLLINALAGAIPVIFELAGCIVTLLLKLLYDHTEWGHQKQYELGNELLAALHQQAGLQQYPAGHNSVAGHSDPGTSVYVKVTSSATAEASTAARDMTVLVQDPFNRNHIAKGTGSANKAQTGYAHSISSTTGSHGNLKSFTGSFTFSLFDWGAKPSAGAAYVPGAPTGSTVGSTVGSTESSTHHASGTPLVHALIHQLQQVQKLPWYLQPGIRSAAALPSSSSSASGQHCCCCCHRYGTPELPAVQAAQIILSPGGIGNMHNAKSMECNSRHASSASGATHSAGDVSSTGMRNKAVGHCHSLPIYSFKQLAALDYEEPGPATTTTTTTTTAAAAAAAAAGVPDSTAATPAAEQDISGSSIEMHSMSLSWL